VSREVEKVVGVGFVLVVIGALWMTSATLRPVEEGEALPRREAPELRSPLLSGPDFVLSDHRGKIVIVDFWATWCGPCEVQMPVLDTLWKNQRGRDVVIVGVSVDTDPAEKISAWLAERGLEYPIALGNQTLARDFGVMGYPTLVIVDPDGGIHTHHAGVLSRPELEEILDEIRNEERPLG